MVTDSKTPNTDDEPIIAPCLRCRKEIPTHYAIKGYDPEGNIVDTIAADLCSDCKADAVRRGAEALAAAARREAIAEKKRAEIFSRVPKQMHLNMGLD